MLHAHALHVIMRCAGRCQCHGMRFLHALPLIALHCHWQDVAASADDGPLRAAVEGGCVTFVHQAVDQPGPAALADGDGADAPSDPAAQLDTGAALACSERFIPSYLVPRDASRLFPWPHLRDNSGCECWHHACMRRQTGQRFWPLAQAWTMRTAQTAWRLPAAQAGEYVLFSLVKIYHDVHYYVSHARSCLSAPIAFRPTWLTDQNEAGHNMYHACFLHTKQCTLYTPR